MSDPKRWADEGGDATAFERELFRSGRTTALPAEEKRRRWLAIAEQAALLPAAGVAPAPHGLAGKAAAKGLAGTGWLKAVVLLPVLAGAGAGTYALTHSTANHAASTTATHATNHDAHADQPPAAATAAPVAAPSHDEPEEPATRASAVKPASRVRHHAPAVPTADTSSSATDVAIAETARASRLSEEARAVLDARNALLSGNPSSALGVLSDARTRFPDGSLGQEREALTIEALARAGRKQTASARARAFLARFPNSPLASNVRRYE